jgi:hypothetical protein
MAITPTAADPFGGTAAMASRDFGPIFFGLGYSQAMRTCSFLGCDRKHVGHGLCHIHLERKRRGSEERPAGPRDHVARFWAKVQKTETCWLWLGWKDADGYGQFSHGPFSTRSHRFSLELAIGPAPADKPFAIHSCDNRGCVNPDHLRWATPAENSADMVARARQATGDRNASRLYPEKRKRGFGAHFRAKFPDDEVREIRRLVAGGTPSSEIARARGVWKSTVDRIAKRIVYRHVQ